jgi:ATP-binding cassette subfamily B multidrug efflux pump
MGMPVEKAKDFRGTLVRLLRHFKPQRYRLLAVVVAAVIGTVFNVVGPKILGLATTKLFEGVLLESRGTGTVDFGYIERLLLILVGLYVVSACFQYVQQYLMATVAQKTVYAIRREVDEKLERLPLRFYDAHTHGELLSRAVNDLDNISSTLQQNLTQLITSLVTVVGEIVLMHTISQLLSVVVVLTLPLSLFVTATIARRSQRFFRQQQMHSGGSTAMWKRCTRAIRS